jgi:peptidoglycan/LPS O-acetylase OafA/YrhL
MIGDLDTLAARTPPTRDRYVDFLRGASILVVVLGHWLVLMIWWQDELIYTTNAIGVTSGLWLATWVLQVMPIFFFVGGFSNYVALDGYRGRGESTWAFVRSRIARLLRPSLVFLAAWTVVQIALHVADIGRPSGIRLWGETRLLRGMNPPASTLPFGPLWFLGVYLVVVALSPLTIWLHRRFRWWIPAILAGSAIAADAVGFGLGLEGVRYLNVAFVLLFPHQLGHFYADGTFARLPRRAFWVMAVGGLAALVLLTNPPLFEALGGDARFRWFPGIGFFPKSLIGTGVEHISNAYPPTICYLAVGVWTIGAAMLLRDRITGWLDMDRPWRAVILTNSVIMTLFLWHMTAYLVAILALWPLGFGHEHEATARWWVERFVWVGAPALVLTGIVSLVGRFERPTGGRTSAPRDAGAVREPDHPTN